MDHKHEGDPVEGALARLVESIAREVSQGHPERMRVCANEECRWVFHDTSRCGRRKWCDMATCGNRAKVARHREKSRRELVAGVRRRRRPRRRGRRLRLRRAPGRAPLSVPVWSPTTPTPASDRPPVILQADRHRTTDEAPDPAPRRGSAGRGVVHHHIRPPHDAATRDRASSVHEAPERPDQVEALMPATLDTERLTLRTCAPLMPTVGYWVGVPFWNQGIPPRRAGR